MSPTFVAGLVIGIGIATVVAIVWVVVSAVRNIIGASKGGRR